MFGSRELQRGSAEILVLGLLKEREMYGYEIIQELGRRSEGYFAMEEGLLYPTLHRLERQGLASGEWRQVDRRRRRYYVATEAGLRSLNTSVNEWKTFAQRFLGVVEGSPSHAEASI